LQKKQLESDKNLPSLQHISWDVIDYDGL